MGATLLLADDSVTIQRVIELTFADEDVRVVVAGDGEQAIRKIDSEAPDIVLADIGMPRVDGYAVAAHVKQSPALKHIPVLLLTGAFEPIDEARARATGCDGVLVKPFEPQKLVSRVRELLDGARGAEMWPADMPRAQAAPAPESAPAQPRQPETVQPVLAEPAVHTIPELLREPQMEVPAPPLSLPAERAPVPDMMGDIDPIAEPVFDLSEVSMTPAGTAEASEGEDVANRNGGEHASRQARPELPPPADRLDSELDMLDAALSRLDPTANPQELDEETASEFARDLNDLRKDARLDEEPPARPARPSFGSWDLPKPPSGDLMMGRPVDIVAEEIALVAQEPAQSVQVTPSVQAPPPAVQAPPPVVQAPPPTVQAAPPVVQAPPPTVQAAPPIAQAPPPSAPAPTPSVQIPAASPTPAPPAPPAASPRAERPTLAAAFSALLAAEKSAPAAQAAAPQISEAAIEEVVRRVLARMAGDTVNRVVLETAERLIRDEISRTKDPSGR